MRKQISLILLLFMLTWTTGCAVKNTVNDIASKAKPVQLLSLQEETRPIILNYTGIVEASAIKKLAFKSSGKIDAVFVKKGDQIKAGQPLLQLDTKDLTYGLSAARGQMEAAQAQYEKAVNGAVPEDIRQMEANVKKAEAAYIFMKDQYEKLEKLYASGAVSQKDLDKIKVEFDAAEADYRSAMEMEKKLKNGSRPEDKAAAKGQLDQAAADYQHKLSLLEDALIRSGSDGYVIDLLYEEGEMVPAGYPVIVVRNDQQVFKVGLTTKDLNKIHIGTKTILWINGKPLEGTVTNIHSTPDQETLTYPVEVSLPSNTWPIGAVGHAEFIIGEAKGIWIPIAAILSNGDDYVFVMKNDRAYQRKIQLLEVEGNRVMVQGLEPGDKLIIGGMKKLKDQDLVSVQD
ncbi:RND family efflux transporter, MFP subunit [Geosporobacter subterraneus DSM 17957]|uniref:RND family efflux transporter, MFP subunit n=1 Tax=Geosporobacter subterraneus DSM 17957 TaxID=1121919 RepID=A0A1M6PMC2_9FIRM|nr:HlyD family efflux transporter periplasmic adaptor subunit [Geosporobacter subterraneus]SHK09099.1 RND family efflux transporter, MFP subunit [Geosporobacter subterraneus DSM 17957]